jgi:hypothetical protein
VSLSKWDIIFWIAGLIGNLTLTSILIYRGRHKSFPWFTLLIAGDALQTLVLFCIHKFLSSDAYFYTYWSLEVWDALLRGLVVWEVGKHLTRQLSMSEPSRRRQDRQTLAGLALMAALLVIFATPHTDELIVTIAVKSSLFSAILIGGLVFSQCLSALFLGVKLRVHAFAIPVGLLLYYSATLLMHVGLLIGLTDFWSQFERDLKPVYLFCLVVWCIVLWCNEPKHLLSEDMARYIFPAEWVKSRISQGDQTVQAPPPPRVPKQAVKAFFAEYLSGVSKPTQVRIVSHIE